MINTVTPTEPTPFSTIFENSKPAELSEADLDAMLQTMMSMKPVVLTENKIIMGCRKHIKALEKKFEIRSVADPRGSMLSGTRVTLYIRPYLKKLYIIDMPKQIL